MIAGAPKAGTSSLKHYMGEHPQVCMHAQREFPFFASDEMYAAGYDNYFQEYFSPCSVGEHLLAAKSAPISCLPQAIDRLYQHNPKMKVILLLRNPIDRAYSSYRFLRQRGIEPLTTFEKAIAEEPRRLSEVNGNAKLTVRWGYVNPGFYVEPVRQLHSLFGTDRVQVYQFEKLQQDPIPICVHLFKWLGVDHTFTPNVKERFNVTKEVRNEHLARGLARFSDTNSPIKHLLLKILPAGFVTEMKYRARKINSRPAKKNDMIPQTRQMLVEKFRRKNKELADIVDIDLTLWE